jgi:predicted O-methyltransferase YrrM
MDKVLIQKFLADNEIDMKEIPLGDFDYIGEYTAKKNRDRNSPLYASVGAFFRPNYERGILIYSLIKKFKLKSYLEVGFGRGYSAVCAAKAFHDIGVDGKVISIDPSFNKEQLEIMSQAFPKEWLQKLDLRQGFSQEILKNDSMKGPWDFVYIDGDHRAPAVQADWENLKDKWNSFLLFDDYHLPTKAEADIECARVIDEIDESKHDATKQLVIMDRRIFIDDRRFTDDQIDYGQCLLMKNHLLQSDEW